MTAPPLITILIISSYQMSFIFPSLSLSPPGSQCLLIENFSPQRLLTGDTLFIGSYGRVDGPDASSADLWQSVNQVIGSLDNDVVIFPAHDYSELKTSTIGHERQKNPVFRMPKAQFVSMN